MTRRLRRAMERERAVAERRELWWAHTLAWFASIATSALLLAYCGVLVAMVVDALLHPVVMAVTP